MPFRIKQTHESKPKYTAYYRARNAPTCPHGACTPRLTLRPAQRINSGSGAPGDFSTSESRTLEQNKDVFAHCNSTLAFANSKVERFVLSVRDQAPRSSEQDGALPSRPSTASEPRQSRPQQANQAGCAKGVCCFFFVRLAPMKNLVGTPELAPCASKDLVLY